RGQLQVHPEGQGRRPRAHRHGKPGPDRVHRVRQDGRLRACAVRPESHSRGQEERAHPAEEKEEARSQGQGLRGESMMRNTLRTFVVAALALAASRVHATPGTCTVTELDVAGTFPFFNVGAVGLALPVDIGTDGTFTLQRDAFTSVYPSPGL